MNKQNEPALTPLEERIMVRSGDLSRPRRMKRAALATSLLFLFLFIAATLATKNYLVVMAVGAAYILLTLVEKLCYIRLIGACHALIVKLGKALNRQ